MKFAAIYPFLFMRNNERIILNKIANPPVARFIYTQYVWCECSKKAKKKYSPKIKENLIKYCNLVCKNSMKSHVLQFNWTISFSPKPERNTRVEIIMGVCKIPWCPVRCTWFTTMYAEVDNVLPLNEPYRAVRLDWLGNGWLEYYMTLYELPDYIKYSIRMVNGKSAQKSINIFFIT